MGALGAVLTGAKYIATHPASHGTAIATVLSAGVYAAEAAGLITASAAGVGVAVATIVGTLVYKMLSPKAQATVDNATQEVVDIVTTIPQTFPADTPTGKNNEHADKPLAHVEGDTNLNKGA